MDLGLAGKAVLVTGASRGIGRATATRLAEEGCAVAICGRNPDDLQRAVDEVAAVGPPVFGLAADVSLPGEVERLVEQAVRHLGRLDLLVANAGGVVGGSLLNSTPEDWAATFELNAGHAARAIRACVPHMRHQGAGAAVVVASISGWKPAPRAQYGAAKAAEIYLAAALARELAPDRIRVNAVSPGSVFAPGGGWDRYRTREPERFENFTEREFPARRLGTPQEVADVIAFLLSDRARWVNGANVAVDGAQGRPSAAGW